MENHPKYQFTNEAITVHDIVGETDDESLMIVSKHVTVIQSEILDQSKQKLPVIKDSENKAIQVKQLNNRIADLSQIL